MHKSGKNNALSDKRTAERVEQCIANLKEVLDLEKVILFGSHARGQALSGSTLDLLIIANTKLDFFERIKTSLVACSGGEPIIEPIVYTPEEFQKLWEHGEGFLEDALEEGIVIYQKQKQEKIEETKESKS